MQPAGHVAAQTWPVMAGKQGDKMDVRVGDVIVTKKNHPCGGNRFRVLRVGMDFRIECETCKHQVMLPRVKIEKNIKQIIRPDETN